MALTPVFHYEEPMDTNNVRLFPNIKGTERKVIMLNELPVQGIFPLTNHPQNMSSNFAGNHHSSNFQNCRNFSQKSLESHAYMNGFKTQSTPIETNLLNSMSESDRFYYQNVNSNIKIMTHLNQSQITTICPQTFARKETRYQINESQNQGFRMNQQSPFYYQWDLHQSGAFTESGNPVTQSYQPGNLSSTFPTNHQFSPTPNNSILPPCMSYGMLAPEIQSRNMSLTFPENRQNSGIQKNASFSGSEIVPYGSLSPENYSRMSFPQNYQTTSNESQVMSQNSKLPYSANHSVNFAMSSSNSSPMDEIMEMDIDETSPTEVLCQKKTAVNENMENKFLSFPVVQKQSHSAVYEKFAIFGNLTYERYHSYNTSEIKKDSGSLNQFVVNDAKYGVQNFSALNADDTESYMDWTGDESSENGDFPGIAVEVEKEIIKYSVNQTGRRNESRLIQQKTSNKMKILSTKK